MSLGLTPLFGITQRVPDAVLFACGSMVLRLPFVCGFSVRSAEKPHTRDWQYHAAGHPELLVLSLSMSIVDRQKECAIACTECPHILAHLGNFVPSCLGG
jgi:hypothetical protein